MRHLLGRSTLLLLLAAGAAQAGNTSSNSSSNSSNGVHTRIDTLVRDDDRGRRFFERRYRRYDGFRERSGFRGRDGFRGRGYGYRSGSRRWRGDDDDD